MSLLATFERRWSALTVGTRRIVFALVGVVAIAVAVVTLATRDTRVALFANPLGADQLTEVERQLAAWNTPYTPGATNVRVDPHRRADLLLRLGAAGVPHAHLASRADALADAGALTPPAVFDARSRAGLEGDLAGALRGMAGIADARVLLAPGRTGTFADDPGSPGSASVRLTLAAGAHLGADEVAGIRRFVAAGVSGLDASRVAVLDDRGVPLDDAQLDSEALDRRVAALQSALDAAFGAGVTIVRAAVERDPAARDVRDVRRAPVGGNPIGSTRTQERYTGPKRAYDKNEASEDRGSDLRDERTQLPAGRVARISIAILLDDRRRGDAPAIRAFATAAAGLRPERGDRLDVTPIAFARPAPVPPHPLALTAAALLDALPGFALALVLGLALRAAMPHLAEIAGAVRARLTVAATTRAVRGAPPRAVRGALLDEPPHTAAAVISALPAATAAAVLELYPPDERAAIVKRLSREVAPLGRAGLEAVDA